MCFSTVFVLDDDFDEDDAVHEVVCNMLEKDVVDVCSVNNGTMFRTKTKKFRDPTPKMKLRHEQVIDKRLINVCVEFYLVL